MGRGASQAARDHAIVGLCGCSGGAGLLLVPLFPLPIIPPISQHSSYPLSGVGTVAQRVTDVPSALSVGLSRSPTTAGRVYRATHREARSPRRAVNSWRPGSGALAGTEHSAAARRSGGYRLQESLVGSALGLETAESRVRLFDLSQHRVDNTQHTLQTQ